MVIWATGGIVSQSLDALIISKVEIVKSAVASFTLSPTTLNATCGSSISQTFTVINGNNSPVTSYEWNLGSSSNGWSCNGNPAPQTISTTTNSITLTSNGCSSLSNVSVTPKNNATNYTTLNATINLSLPQFSITGKSIICNSETYTLNGSLPCNATVTWSLPSSAGSVLQFSPNPPTGTSVTLTNQKWYGVSTTLTATISNLGCSANPITVTKSIANDNDQSSSSTYSYSQEACNYYNVSHPANSGTITSNSSPRFVHQGCNVYVNIGDVGAYNKTVTFIPTGPSQVTNPIFWYYSGSQLVFALPLGSGGIPFTFRISGDGACYEKNLLFFSYSNNGRTANSNEYTFSIAPNPVKDILTVTAQKDHEHLPGLKLALLQWTSTIYQANTTRPVLIQRSSKGNMTQIDVSKLSKGLYVIEIKQGSYTQSIKFIKE